jgi:hypothetical protein
MRWECPDNTGGPSGDVVLASACANGNTGVATMGRISLSTTLSIGLLLASMQSIAAAEDYTKPTKHHEAMAEDVGVWDADVTMYMPGSEPAKSKAVETNEMMGKMWLMSKFEGEFGGEKFSGASAVGYDPIKKKYTGGWVDTMSPFMMKMEGDYDEDSKTLTMIGEGIDAMTGKPSKHKMVTKYSSKDTKTFTMFHEAEDGDDEWQKMMVIEYTRRK